MSWAFAPSLALSQTPSPLQEWQYSGGIILARLFQPDLPDWREIAGLAADVAPVFTGSESTFCAALITASALPSPMT